MRGADRHESPDVSILVLLDDSLEGSRRQYTGHFSLVSILVLLDDSLEEQWWELNEPEYQFQSLFSWMIRSKVPRLRGFCRINQFQSLFSWMIRSKFGVRDPMENYLRVSILVLLDDSLEDFIHGFRVLVVLVSILVLLDDSLEDFFLVCIIYYYKFQSLFSWMIRSKSGSGRASRWSHRVSILVLLDDSLEEHQGRIRSQTYVVSILVLLDDSLEVWGLCAGGRGKGVSILVLLDDSLEDCDH